jgi:hypothetical protein
VCVAVIIPPETGKCKKWVTGALSIENRVISDIMGSLGNEKKDITAYYDSKRMMVR